MVVAVGSHNLLCLVIVVVCFSTVRSFRVFKKSDIALLPNGEDVQDSRTRLKPRHGLNEPGDMAGEASSLAESGDALNLASSLADASSLRPQHQMWDKVMHFFGQGGRQRRGRMTRRTRKEKGRNHNDKRKQDARQKRQEDKIRHGKRIQAQVRVKTREDERKQGVQQKHQHDRKRRGKPNENTMIDKPIQATYVFQPGKSLGMDLIRDTGIVKKVYAYGQAYTVGIKTGDRFLKVGNQPFSFDALRRATKGNLDYQVLFQVGIENKPNQKKHQKQQHGKNRNGKDKSIGDELKRDAMEKRHNEKDAKGGIEIESHQKKHQKQQHDKNRDGKDKPIGDELKRDAMEKRHNEKYANGKQNELRPAVNEKPPITSAAHTIEAKAAHLRKIHPNETKEVFASRLSKLTRYLSQYDEETFPLLSAKVSELTRRVDGQMRLASPFEHVCGGSTVNASKTCGNDGPTQYISFSNAGEFPEVGDDCTQSWDKGGRRVRTSTQSVWKQRGLVFDLSDKAEAWKWCYEGGCVTTAAGTQICFKGAKDIRPWPYKCARRTLGLKDDVENPKWWTAEHRWNLGKKCAMWAMQTREVLVLPNPDMMMNPDNKMSSLKTREVFALPILKVWNDRPPAGRDSQNDKERFCVSSFVDRCVSFDRTTNSVLCCSHPSSKTPCPNASRLSYLFPGCNE